MTSERYIAAVDLGTTRISLTVAKVTGSDIQILFFGHTPAMGIRSSAIFSPGRAEGPVKELIRKAEEELNIKIFQVVTGLPRCNVRQEINQAEVSRNNPGESITREEVEALKQLAKDEYPIEDTDNEELYGAIAQSFSSDEDFQLIESDILGVVSSSFKGNFKLFIGRKSAVKAIDKVFNDMSVAVAAKYFTPITAARAILTEDEMENGVAVIDFGGGATSVSVYKGKVMRHYASIPFGGRTITTDIRTECTISEALAENIKLAFGACPPERLQSLGDKIIQIEGDDIAGLKQIPVKYLSEIITARLKEITDAMLFEIQRSGLADDIRSGLVITGGGAALAGLTGYLKEVSGYNVRRGQPRQYFSALDCPEIFSCAATNSAGIVLAAAEDETINCVEAFKAPEPAPSIVPEPEPEPDAADIPVTETSETAGTPEPEPEAISAPEPVTTSTPGPEPETETPVHIEPVRESAPARAKPQKPAKPLFKSFRWFNRLTDKLEKGADALGNFFEQGQ